MFCRLVIFCLCVLVWVVLKTEWKHLNIINKIYITELWFSVMDIFLSQRKSDTENLTSVMTWTWTTRAPRAAPASLATPPAVRGSKPTPASTASQRRWPRRTRTANGKERNAPAQRWAAATPIPLGSTWAARLRRRGRRGWREVRGLLLISAESAALSR